MTHPLITMERKDQIAVVRMNRGEKKNALCIEMIEQLHDAACTLKKDEESKIVILTGSPEGFSAGADRNDSRIFSPETSILEQWHSAEFGSETLKNWENLHQVTVAAIEGFAVGGGFTFAMACDFRVMGRSAFVTIPEVPLGFNYGWNSIPRLINLIGPSRTKRLVMLGERIPAEQAEQWGLADYVADDGGTEAFATNLAGRLLQVPQLPIQFTKRAITATTTAAQGMSSHADMAQIILCLKDAAGKPAKQQEKRRQP